jgi:hypothetical protein
MLQTFKYVIYLSIFTILKNKSRRVRYFAVCVTVCASVCLSHPINILMAETICMTVGMFRIRTKRLNHYRYSEHFLINVAVDHILPSTKLQTCLEWTRHKT